MITHFDNDPEFELDAPLAVILRPAPHHLDPPPGRFEAIRSAAARRRRLRAAATVGLSAAVAVLIVLPFHLTASETPRSPTVPLAPPPASSPSPTPRASTPSRPDGRTPVKSPSRTGRPHAPDEPTTEVPSPTASPRTGAPTTRRRDQVPTPPEAASDRPGGRPST